ncbi:MAG: DNA repair exonuclease [bacterium]
MPDFKFIHAADVHLDSPLRGLARYDTAPVEAIRGASRRALENLVQLALDEEVAFVLLAGDVYDGDWPDFNTGLFFSKQMSRLADADIPVFLVAGNHDAVSKISRTLILPDNVTTFAAERAETVVLDGLEVAIHGQSFTRQEVPENLAAGFPEARRTFNIGLLHTSLTGRPGHAPYAPCTVGDLQAKGYQYWALGHVHQWEEVSADPPIVFPGCLQGRHARETGPKGCALVKVRSGRVASVERRVLDVLRWSECVVDLDGVETEGALKDRVREAIHREAEAAELRPVAMRVILRGATVMNDTLRSAPHEWAAQVRSLSGELVHHDIWVEKVRIDTKGRLSLEEVLTEGSPLSGLLRAIEELEETPAAVPGLEAEAAALKKALASKKLGEWMRSEDGFDPEDPAVLKELIHQAKLLLITRLLVTGGEP